MSGLSAGGAPTAESTVYHLEISGSPQDTATAIELKAFAAAHLPHSVMLYREQVLGSSATLVFDSKAIFEDQLAAVERTSRARRPP